MELLIEVHQRIRIPATSDPKKIIAELIAFAQTQPDGSVVSANFEGYKFDVNKTDTVHSVWTHAIAMRAHAMHPSRCRVARPR